MNHKDVTDHYKNINMYAIYALPIVSSIGGKVVSSPQRVYVEDILSASLVVSSTESSHKIHAARAAVRGIGL